MSFTDKKFVGSSMALVLGWLSFLAGLASVGSGNESGMSLHISGIVILLGTYAYRSLKRTRLGLRQFSTRRRAAEFAALTLVILAVVLQSNLLSRMYSEPFPNVFIPVWVLAAYFFVFFSKGNER